MKPLGSGRPDDATDKAQMLAYLEEGIHDMTIEMVRRLATALEEGDFETAGHIWATPEMHAHLNKLLALERLEKESRCSSSS